MAIEKLNPDTMPKPHGWTQVAVATGSKTIFSAGQAGADLDGNMVGPDYKSQAAQTLRNIYAAVAAGGGSPADIVRLMVYVVTPTREDLDACYAGIGIAMKEAGARAVPMTLICVSGLDAGEGAVVEMDVTAVID